MFRKLSCRSNYPFRLALMTSYITIGAARRAQTMSLVGLPYLSSVRSHLSSCATATPIMKIISPFVIARVMIFFIKSEIKLY